MSRSLDRHRMASKYRQELDELYGDEATTKQVGEGVSTGVSALTELIAKAQKAKADKAKTEEQARHVQPAKDLRAKANAKATEARYASMEADSTEKEPYGPKHKKAQALADEAAKLDSQAREEEVKAGMTPETAMTAATSGGSSHPFVFPTWAKYAAMGLGGVVVIGIGWKIFGGSRPVPRYARGGAR